MSTAHISTCSPLLQGTHTDAPKTERCVIPTRHNPSHFKSPLTWSATCTGLTVRHVRPPYRGGGGWGGAPPRSRRGGQWRLMRLAHCALVVRYLRHWCILIRRQLCVPALYQEQIAFDCMCIAICGGTASLGTPHSPPPTHTHINTHFAWEANLTSACAVQQGIADVTSCESEQQSKRF
jgi:hypothetical protein